MHTWMRIISYRLCSKNKSRYLIDLRSLPLNRIIYQKNRVNWQPQMKTLILPAILCLLSIVSRPVNSQKKPSAIDANALVKRMMATYQNATTVQETTEARIVIEGKSEYISTTSMKYKKPNFLIMNSMDNETGTVKTYVNGRLATIYSGKENLFTKRTADTTVATNLTKMLDIISGASADILGAPQHQVLAPIDFIAAKDTLKEAKHFKYVRDEVINGRKTVLLMGEADITWLKETLGDLPTVPPIKVVLLWIDPVTNLLIKGGLRVSWSTPEAVKKHTKLPQGVAFDEIHRGTTLNAPIKDSEFQFFPPKNAIEKFQDHK